MKNKLGILTALALLAVSGFLQAAQPVVSMEIIPASLPALASPNSTIARTNAVWYIKDGVAATGSRTTDPKVTAPIFDGKLYAAEDNTISSTTPLWMGQLSPTLPALSSERGNLIFFGLRISSSTPFKLEDIRFSMSSNDTGNSLGHTTRLNTISYSVFTVGLRYGADGIKGTADDSLVMSGAGTQLVNEIYFVGVANGYVGNTVAAIQNIRDYIAQQPVPFAITAKYELLDSGGQTIASAVKVLSVAPVAPTAPSVTIIIDTNGLPVITLNGATNQNYSVQRRFDLGTTNSFGATNKWITVASGTSGVANSAITNITSTNAVFYRIVAPQ